MQHYILCWSQGCRKGDSKTECDNSHSKSESAFDFKISRYIFVVKANSYADTIKSDRSGYVEPRSNLSACKYVEITANSCMNTQYPSYVGSYTDCVIKII